MRKALVAMSGGVDSAVAAAKSAERYAATGVTMLMCSTDTKDAEEAKRTCERLGIDHVMLCQTDAFDAHVKAPFVRAYEQGETPNPCLLCNRYLKFGVLLEYALAHGFDTLVTGHYARVERDADTGRYRLLRAKCAEKDQSYVLYALTQQQLSHVYFPLGEVSSKDEVRAKARLFGFESAARGDSQDICFIPDGNYGAFIERYTGKSYPVGDFVLQDGTVVGRHRGLIHYTVGQRKGLGVALGEPMYVLGTDTRENTVTLATNDALFSTALTVRDVRSTMDGFPDTFRAEVKVRYKARPAMATVKILDGARARITFDEPQRAITPGQAAVFYDGDAVLGGGIIERL